MTILDRYFTKQLLLPILFCSLALIFLVYMSDLFNHLDEIIKNRTSLALVFKYYAALFPQTFVSTISWASLLGVLYVLTMFNYHNELIAMKVAGLEIGSIIRPILFVGFVLGIATFLMSDQVVPKSYQLANEIKHESIEQKPNQSQKTGAGIFENVTHYGGRERLYYARRFDSKKQTIDDLIILWLDAQKNIKKKTVAHHARWKTNVWELHQCSDYNLQTNGELIGEPTYRELAIYSEVSETPDEFVRAASQGPAISFKSLKEYIGKLKQSGIKLDSENVLLHYKLAAPWQSLIVMLLSIPLVARTTSRKMIALNVLMCLGLVVLFHVSGAVSLALGKAGKLFPMLSAWASSILFGFGAFFFLKRANS